jgi:hypothetical protein
MHCEKMKPRIIEFLKQFIPVGLQRSTAVGQLKPGKTDHIPRVCRLSAQLQNVVTISAFDE